MEQTATRFATGHVGLNVTDLARAKRFYQDVFGFAVMMESQEPGRAFAFLAQGNDVVLTLWEQSRGTSTTDRPGLHHLSFMVESIEQVRETERRLREMGTRIFHEGIVPHAEGMESGGLYFEGPDRIRLEVFAPSGAAGERPAPNGAAPTCGFF